MNCCGQPDTWDEVFDVKMARSELKKYRRGHVEPTTKALVELLKQKGVKDATLLDIGGGVGAIHHELLDAGAASAVHADASAQYIAAAREESEKRGHADRVDFVYGDFVEQAPVIAKADVVTLDRVICCYPDMPALVLASASRARRFYGASFPRERWFLRVGFFFINAFMALRRRTFRIFMHAHADIDAVLQREGLKRVASARTFAWQVVIYARP